MGEALVKPSPLVAQLEGTQVVSLTSPTDARVVKKVESVLKWTSLVVEGTGETWEDWSFFCNPVAFRIRRAWRLRWMASSLAEMWLVMVEMVWFNLVSWVES